MSYSDALVRIIQERARQFVQWRTLGVVEAGIGLLWRAFLSARCSHPAVTPAVAGCLVRELLTEGNGYAWIRTGGGQSLRLYPASAGYVWGTVDTWIYRLDIPAPSAPMHINLLSDAVVHVAYAPTVREPWRGRAPLDIGDASSSLAQALEIDLEYEARVPIGRIIPVPEGTDTDTEGGESSLESQMRELKGGVAFPETTQAGYGAGPGAAPHRDWVPQRLGPEYDRGVVEARAQTSAIMLSMLGVPPGLLLGGSEGSAEREQWRRCLHGTIMPLAHLLEDELTRKLDTDVIFDFSSLAASDLAGRARAFQSMVHAGMDVNLAAVQSGLTDGEAGQDVMGEQPSPRPGYGGAPGRPTATGNPPAADRDGRADRQTGGPHRP